MKKGRRCSGLLVDEQGWISAKRTEVRVQLRVWEKRHTEEQVVPWARLFSGCLAGFKGGGSRVPQGHSYVNLFLER